MKMLDTKNILSTDACYQGAIKTIEDIIQQLRIALDGEMGDKERGEIINKIKELNSVRQELLYACGGGTSSDCLGISSSDNRISDYEKQERLDYFVSSLVTMCLSGYPEDIAVYKKELLEKMEDYNFHIIHISPSDVYNPERKECFADDFWTKIKKETDKIRKRFGQKGYKKQSLYETLAFNTIEDEEGFGHYILIDFDKVEELFTLDIPEEERRKLFHMYELLFGLRKTNYNYYKKYMPNGKTLKFIPPRTRFERAGNKIVNRMIMSVNKKYFHDFWIDVKQIPNTNFYAC